MKHAASTIWETVDPSEPKHSFGWTPVARLVDSINGRYQQHPGRHAKPFAKHHPATPVTYDTAGMTTPLVTAAPVLDVAA